MGKMWTREEEKREAGKEEFLGVLKVLETELGDKPFFGGDVFGYVDVALIGFYNWFLAYEAFGYFVIDTECPKLGPWANRCLRRKAVAHSLPDNNEVMEISLRLRTKLGIQ